MHGRLSARVEDSYRQCEPLICIPEHFEVRSVLYRHADFQVLEVSQAEGPNRQLTVFARRVSGSPEFRAAFRLDMARLTEISHDHILPLTEWGEHDGLFYVATELPEMHTLADGGPGSFEELLDVAWQIASVVQHLHNCGITHGHLLPDVISLEPGLRVQVQHCGLHRWIQAAHHPEIAQRPWSAWASTDLQQLGSLLHDLLTGVPAESPETPDEIRSEFLSLLDDLKEPHIDLLARDVQGRLGDLLLRMSGEKIEMVDARSGSHLPDRSIVDELFEEPIHDRTLHHSGPTGPPASRQLVIAALALAALVGIVVSAWLLV